MVNQIMQTTPMSRNEVKRGDFRLQFTFPSSCFCKFFALNSLQKHFFNVILSQTDLEFLIHFNGLKVILRTGNCRFFFISKGYKCEAGLI